VAQNLSVGLFKDLGDAVQSLPVKASATWDAGNLLKLSSGYLEACGNGDIPVGVAVAVMDSDSTPSSSGDVSALVYVGTNNQYRLNVETGGTAAITMVGKKMDVDSASTAETTDAVANGALCCVGVDVDANQVIVVLNQAAWAGVA